MSGLDNPLLLFAIRDIPLHFIESKFADAVTIFILVRIRSVHVDVHDVFSNHLIVCIRSMNGIYNIMNGAFLRTLSLCSLCSSFTMKIMSNLDKIVVWKSIFCQMSSAFNLSQ